MMYLQPSTIRVRKFDRWNLNKTSVLAKHFLNARPAIVRPPVDANHVNIPTQTVTVHTPPAPMEENKIASSYDFPKFYMGNLR